jgi:hypothetical protein
MYRVMVGKPEGGRPLGKTRRRWEDKNKVELREEGCGEWTRSSWLRIERVCGHLLMR